MSISTSLSIIIHNKNPNGMNLQSNVTNKKQNDHQDQGKRRLHNRVNPKLDQSFKLRSIVSPFSPLLH